VNNKRYMITISSDPFSLTLIRRVTSTKIYKRLNIEYD
jgi:hypothetical protein